MDKVQALVSFWNSVSGLAVYDENAVPDNAQMPYITCEIQTASFEHEIPLSATLWYRDTSWEAISVKADSIAKALYELRGTAQKIEGGRFRIYEGDTPLCQRMPAEKDDVVKRIVINIMVEFMTAY